MWYALVDSFFLVIVQRNMMAEIQLEWLSLEDKWKPLYFELCTFLSEGLWDLNVLLFPNYGFSFLKNEIWVLYWLGRCDVAHSGKNWKTCTGDGIKESLKMCLCM